MAVGTVSSVNYDNWQLIATVTSNGGTSTTTVASGIVGYKKLMLVWSGVSLSSATYLALRFNATTSGYLGGGWSNSSNNATIASTTRAFVEGTTSSSGKNGYAIIDNILSGGPKTYQGFGATNTVANSFGGVWDNTNAITSVSMVPELTQTFSGGTMTLYGIAA